MTMHYTPADEKYLEQLRGVRQQLAEHAKYMNPEIQEMKWLLLKKCILRRN